MADCLVGHLMITTARTVHIFDIYSNWIAHISAWMGALRLVMTISSTLVAICGVGAVNRQMAEPVAVEALAVRTVPRNVSDGSTCIARLRLRSRIEAR